MRKVIFIALILFTGSLLAQVKGTLEGTITDGETNETLIGVNIITNESTGTTTDFDGNYTLTLPIGKYELKISYVGYETIKAKVEIKEGTTTLNFAMEYQAKEFDDVVISGSRYAKRASEEVISIEVIKPQLADKTNSIRLDDLIKKVSGVNVADGQASIRAGSSWSYSVGSRVNIVLDGQSLLTPDRSSIRWQYLPMENIGQIEVLKGASSILYGSSAMNGTIHLQTIKPTTTPEMKFVSYVGMLDDYADPDYKKPGRARLNTGGYFSRAHKVSDKFEYVLGFNANYSELPYDEYIDYHLRTNLYTKWNNQAKRSSAGFRLNFSHYQESEFIFWKGPDELALTPIEAIRFKYYNFNIDPYYTKFDKKGNRHELKSRAYYYNPNNSIKGGFINLDYQFHKRFNNAWTVISGASAESLAAYDDSFVPQFQTAFKWAVYAQVDKEWEKVSLTGGVRSEFFKFNNGFGAAYGFVRNDKVSGEIKEVPVPLMRMGVNYNPVKNTFVRFNIGQAFRLPSIVEYFVEYEFSGISIVSNPDLKPEYGWTAELGFKQNWQTPKKVYTGSIDLAIFWQEYKDLVEFQPALENGVALKPVNLPTARIAGYELTFKQNVSAKTNNLSLDFGYTYAFPVQQSGLIGSQYKNVGNYIKDLFKYAGKIENTPTNVQRNAMLKYRNRHLVNMNAEYNNDFFSLGVYARYYSNIENGDFEFDSGDISIIPGITDYWQSKFPQGDLVIDLNIGYHFTKQHSIGFNIKNLTNREYSLRLAKIEAPRSFTWQYKFTF